MKKEIFVKNNGTAHFEFAVDSTLTKSLQNNSIILSNGSEKIFQTEKPYLLTTDYSPLLNSISLVENSSGNFEYVYDEANLPEEYILDPSAGPNIGGTFSTDFNDDYCLSTADDCGAYSGLISGENGGYIQATNFEFNIPSGAIITNVSAKAVGSASAPFGGTCGVYETQLQLIVGGSAVGTNISPTNTWCQGSTTIFTNNGSPSGFWGTSLSTAQVNASNFGIKYSFLSNNAEGGDIVSVDYIALTITYTTSTACNVPAECGTQGCVSSICDACTNDNQCGSGNCNEGTGICQGSVNGNSCSVNSDCLSGSCIDGYCTGVCGNTCASMTLPSGYGIMKQSDNSIISFSSLTSASTPIWIVKDPTGVKTKIMSLAVARYSAGSSCNYSGFTVDTDTSTYKSVFHDAENNLDFGTAGRKYSLYIPKSSSHDRIRLCSGKSSIGCTSSDSWSFLANSAGSIVSINGGFDTTGITVSVVGSYWVVTGLTGTSGQGEVSGGGGGDVPSFSTIGLLILLGGCYMMMKKNELVEG